jgi:hypothetical protein
VSFQKSRTRQPARDWLIRIEVEGADEELVQAILERAMHAALVVARDVPEAEEDVKPPCGCSGS